MTAHDQTLAANPAITIRDERFNRDTTPSRWWAGEPFGTAWHNALSGTFPRGEAFFIVRLIGGGYLVYLGVRLWLRLPAGVDTAPVEPGGCARTFFSGVLLTLGNPKVILFYLGLLPTFVDLSELGIADIGLLAVMFISILGGTLSAYAYAAARARLLFRSKRAMKRVNRGTGIVLAGTGGTVATS
mgnify:CR=1 FL=1